MSKRPSKSKRLKKLCRKFIRDNQITCPESIMQLDSIMEQLPELLESICHIVGYHQAGKQEKSDK